MADVLIRDLSEAVPAGVDAHAARLGLSRVECIRRRLAADAATTDGAVSADDLAAFGDLAGDLADPEVMGAAWQWCCTWTGTSSSSRHSPDNPSNTWPSSVRLSPHHPHRHMER